jgi:hypothetical protein
MVRLKPTLAWLNQDVCDLETIFLGIPELGSRGEFLAEGFTSTT